MIENEEVIVGGKIWLEYFDQNSAFEKAFAPQYVTIVKRFADTDGNNDWFLVLLERPFEYEGSVYDHLLIRSRWVGSLVGSKEPTAVFIVLVPESNKLINPFKLDRSLYIAWGFTARVENDIKR